MPMTGNIDRVEVITSVRRRRRWSAEEKARIVQETYAPGMPVSLVARQHGVAPNQVFKWRQLYAEGALSAGISAEARDAAVDELIALVGAIDAIVQAQAAADGDYFARTCGRQLSAPEARMMQQTMLEAYRFQYILSVVRHPHFASTLASLTTDAQLGRIHEALASLAPVRMLEAA